MAVSDHVLLPLPQFTFAMRWDEFGLKGLPKLERAWNEEWEEFLESARVSTNVRILESVIDLWKVEDPVERERNAVRAMRAVVAADDARAQVATVFEAVGWCIKPLSWAGVPGAGIAADARDVGGTVFEIRRRHRDWLLIKPRMQDISLRDYLRRTENY